MKNKGLPRVPPLLVFSTVSTAILILLYLSLGRLTFKYEAKVRAELKERQARLAQSQELIRSVPNPQKAIEEVEKKIEEFKGVGASKKQLPRLMQVLGQAASERNIMVISLKPREDLHSGSENLPEGVNKIFLEMDVSAAYQDLADYVKALAELPISFNVESMTIEKNKDADSSSPVPAQEKSGKNTKAVGLLRAHLLLSSYMVWEL